MGQGPGLSSAPLGLHTWEQKLILFGTAAWSHTHKQGLGGGGLHLLTESTGEEASQRLSLFFQRPSRTQQNGKGRLELNNIPMAARAIGDDQLGTQHFSLASEVLPLLSQLGVTTPWCRQRAGTWWQDLFQRGPLESRARARSGQCQWATGDSSFCRRRRRSSAASGSPSSGSSSAAPTDSGARQRSQE